MCFINKRDKRRNQRTRSLEQRDRNGAKTKIKDVDVKWPNTAEGKGWKISDYEKEIKEI